MKNNTSNNDNDTNNNTPYNIPLTPSDPENKVDIKAVHKSHQRRVLRKHFKSFIAFMDQHVDYYLLNMSNAIATNEKNTEDTKKNYTSSTQKSNYAKFTDNSCPECAENAIMECGCDFKDRQCSKGHVWYTSKKGIIIKGDPHD